MARAVAQARAQRAQSSAYCSVVAVSKCFIIFEQGALHFHFALGPTNYVASLALNNRSLNVDVP